MNKLQQLYQERDTFSKYGSKVPAALAAQIAEAEKEMLQMELLPIIEGSVLKTLPTYGIDGKVLIAMEYDNCALTRIAIASDADKINDFDVVKDISSAVEEPAEEYVPEPDDEDEKPWIRRSASIGFSVRFDDGKVIAEKNAKMTMIEALRYMGLERASQYNCSVKGFPIIGLKKRITENNEKWQHYTDGWWIYTNLSNEKKIEHIKNIGKLLNIPLEVILNKEKKEAEGETPAKQKGKRAMFSLNHGPVLNKKRTVLNAVSQFINEMPNATFKDICDFFPRELQGSYGVVRSVDDIERRKLKNTSEEGRWFLAPEDILTTADGVRFAVCTQWGDNFASFQTHVTEQLGWPLEEVE